MSNNRTIREPETRLYYHAEQVSHHPPSTYAFIQCGCKHQTKEEQPHPPPKRKLETAANKQELTRNNYCNCSFQQSLIWICWRKSILWKHLRSSFCFESRTDECFFALAVSAFYFECPDKQMSMNASVWTKSKFMGMSIGVVMVGKGTFPLLPQQLRKESVRFTNELPPPILW